MVLYEKERRRRETYSALVNDVHNKGGTINIFTTLNHHYTASLNISFKGFVINLWLFCSNSFLSIFFSSSFLWWCRHGLWLLLVIPTLPRCTRERGGRRPCAPPFVAKWSYFFEKVVLLLLPIITPKYHSKGEGGLSHFISFLSLVHINKIILRSILVLCCYEQCTFIEE